VPGTSYGERYQASLQTRRVEKATYQGDYVQIDWFRPAGDAISTEVVYEDLNGDEIVITTPRDEDQTILADFKPKTTIKYRTLFMPDTTSIDTFYSEYTDVQLEYLLNKAKFKRWNTADFPYTEYNM